MCYDGNIGAGFENTDYCDRMHIRGFEVGTHEKDIGFPVISRCLGDHLPNRLSGG
jgi:hypothetical protein